MRLLQFLVLGGAIFLVSTRLRGSDDDIRLSRAELAAMAQVDPQRTTGEIEERAFEDEVLYREGLRLGFDKNDTLVKQRVIQKTLFLAEELAGASEPPTESDLHAFYDRTRARWTRPERWHLVLRFAHDRAALPDHGESSPLPSEGTLDRVQLAGMVGEAFVAALPRQAGAEATIRSPLGWHFVRVQAYQPEAPASYDEVRASLIGAFVVERRQAAVAAFLERSFSKYRVTLDGAPVGELHPRGRVAIRKPASAED